MSKKEMENLAKDLSNLQITRKAIHKDKRWRKKLRSDDMSDVVARKEGIHKKVQSSSDLIKVSETGEFYGVVLKRGSAQPVNLCRVIL